MCTLRRKTSQSLYEFTVGNDFPLSNMLLCHMRVTDETVWQLLTNHKLKKVGNETTSRLHAQILMAGRYAEAL
jgi:hypothetical protein